MKKILAIALALSMIFALCAVAASAEGGKVGISMPTKSLERWNRDGSYLKEQFEAAGYEVELTYSDNDVVQQNNGTLEHLYDVAEAFYRSHIERTE